MVAEIFLRAKSCMTNRYRFKTREEVERVIFEYIEMYRNTKGTCLTPWYLSLVDFEKNLLVS